MSEPASRDAVERIVLVPGLWMPGWVMRLLARRLRRAGWTTSEVGYRAVRLGLDENARELARVVEASRGRAALVAHSTGGVVALRMVELGLVPSVACVVCLGAPWGDVYAARYLRRWSFGRRAVGRTLEDWLAMPRRTLPYPVPVGAIAGCRKLGIGALVVHGMPEPNDGVVTVEETRVPGMADHLVMPVSHATLLASRAVAGEVASFVRTGRFGR